MRYAFGRLFAIATASFGILILTFVLMRLVPGDPVQARLGERGIDPERYARLVHELGLDQPLYRQFLSYLAGVMRGDLGMSLVSRKPVLSEFLNLFPATLELSFLALLIAVCLGVPAGVVASLRRNSRIDYSIMSVSLVGYSMPIFWWGLLLIMTFSVGLGITPVSGRIGLEYFVPETTGLMVIDAILSGNKSAVISALSHLVLPSIVLGTVPLAIIARMTRSSMLEVLKDDYVRTARAKGLREPRVIGVHALRCAIVPVITVVGLQIGTLVSGAIITETIFSWPGIGKWTVEAIGRRDYPTVQGSILLIGMLVMAINLVIDLLCGMLDPRLRYGA